VDPTILPIANKKLQHADESLGLDLRIGLCLDLGIRRDPAASNDVRLKASAFTSQPVYQDAQD
jgi:hypothetical protein